jgi:hypothetical protein
MDGSFRESGRLQAPKSFVAALQMLAIAGLISWLAGLIQWTEEAREAAGVYFDHPRWEANKYRALQISPQTATSGHA